MTGLMTSPVHSGREQFRRLHYIPMRSDVIDIIETPVAEDTGKIVSFALGVTVLFLHLRYEYRFEPDLTHIKSQQLERVSAEPLQSIQDPFSTPVSFEGFRMESGFNCHLPTQRRCQLDAIQGDGLILLES